MKASAPISSASPGQKFIATLAMVAFLNLFVYHSLGSLAVSGILCAISVFFTVLQKNMQVPASRVLVAVSLCSAAAVSFRTNPAMIAASFMVSLLSLILYVYCADLPDGYVRHVSELILVPFRLLFAALAGMVRGWDYVLRRRDTAGGYVKSLVIGLLAGIPVMLILTGMLSQADPIFSKFTANFFSGALVNRLIAHGVVSGVSFAFFLPLAFIAVKRSKIDASAWIGRARFSRELSVVIALVCAVMAAFLYVQWPYIFVRVAAETDLSRYGVATYSEYVKRGFGELVVVSVLLYVLSWAGYLSVRAASARRLSIPSVMQGILFAEAAVFIASIFRRIVLYVQFHGLTLGRVYGGVFLFAVSWLFVTLAGRMFKRSVRWVVVESAGLVLLYAAMVFVNADRIIATTYPPTVNGSVDYVYLSRLSPDGFDGWKRSYASLSVLPDIESASAGGRVINKNQRTTVYYSGFIIRQLFARYQRYMSQYAPVDDVRSYVRTVFSERLRDIDADMPTIQKRASDEKKRKEVLGAYGELEKQLNAERLWLRQQLDGGLVRPLALVQRIYISPVPYEFSTAQEHLAESFVSVNTSGDLPRSPRGALDRLYVWNAADASAYGRMRAEIPFPAVLAAYRTYIGLRRRIAAQPLSEQNYDQDSSFDGPFLSPLY